MSVKIADCTIRDGGYLLNKNTSPEYVRGILKGLVEAGIDFVETGFLQTQVTEDSLVYANSIDARRFLPSNRGKTQFIGFCDNSRYSSDNLDYYDGKSFRWLRISFAKHELESAVSFCVDAINKGYLVQFNPMDAISYSQDEIYTLVQTVNEIKPNCISIVDTFGSMYLEDLQRLFRQIDESLNKSISIGLHSHDNLGLSNAMAETMVDLAIEYNRDIIVDGSLLGMGRGAGNAKTELIAAYINKKYGGDYCIEILLDTIEKYVALMRKEIVWGYDIPMFICGSLHSHVDNVYFIQNHMDVSMRNMYKIIQMLNEDQRIRYGKNYRKTDFSDLRKICEKIGEGE